MGAPLDFYDELWYHLIMNIFILDLNTRTCAEYHNDRHVVKMILESCQLLSTAHRVLDGSMYQGRTATGRKVSRWKLSNNDQLLYQATHINHPCAVWCRDSVENYNWLWSLTNSLAQEYTARYGKVHKCESDGLIAILRTPPIHIPQRGWSAPAQAMPDECKHSDAVTAYRSYYRDHKQHLAKWTGRPVPVWYTHGE